LGTESIEKEGLLHTEMDGKIIHGKSQRFKGIIMTFFDGVYTIVNGKEEPVTGEDGLRVMQIAAIQK
jgi:hypothetical protein